MWLAVMGFMEMRLVSGLSLTDHSDPGSFLVVHTLLSQDGCQRGGFWEVAGHMASPFDLSSWWWLVSSELLIRTSCYNSHKWLLWQLAREGGISQHVSRNFLQQNKSHGNLKRVGCLYNARIP